MRQILEIDPVDRVAVVEPGVPNLDLSKAAAPFGLFYAPDPSSQQACSIGGNVAENAGRAALPGARGDPEPRARHGGGDSRRRGRVARRTGGGFVRIRPARGLHRERGDAGRAALSGTP